MVTRKGLRALCTTWTLYSVINSGFGRTGNNLPGHPANRFIFDKKMNEFYADEDRM